MFDYQKELVEMDAAFERQMMDIKLVSNTSRLFIIYDGIHFMGRETVDEFIDKCLGDLKISSSKDEIYDFMERYRNGDESALTEFQKRNPQF